MSRARRKARTVRARCSRCKGTRVVPACEHGRDACEPCLADHDVMLWPRMCPDCITPHERTAPRVYPG